MLSFFNKIFGGSLSSPTTNKATLPQIVKEHANKDKIFTQVPLIDDKEWILISQTPSKLDPPSPILSIPENFFCGSFCDYEPETLPLIEDNADDDIISNSSVTVESNNRSSNRLVFAIFDSALSNLGARKAKRDKKRQTSYKGMQNATNKKNQQIARINKIRQLHQPKKASSQNKRTNSHRQLR